MICHFKDFRTAQNEYLNYLLFIALQLYFLLRWKVGYFLRRPF